MKACRNLTKSKRKRTTRASGKKSRAATVTVQPASSPDQSAGSDSASWQRIAAAVERSNADLIQRMAKMTRSLRLLRDRLKSREAGRG